MEVDSPGVAPRPRHAIERTQQLRTLHGTVHRHAVDLLELGQVLVQHLGAGLERRARRLVALVLAAPLAAHTCVGNGPFAARVSARASATHVVAAHRSMPDAGAVRSNSMAPLAKGTPCCTTVALGAAAGAKALAPRAISATRTFCILQLCCLSSCFALSVPLHGEHEFLGPGGAVRAVDVGRSTFFYHFDASASLSRKLAACKTLGNPAQSAPRRASN